MLLRILNSQAGLLATGKKVATAIVIVGVVKNIVAIITIIMLMSSPS